MQIKRPLVWLLASYIAGILVYRLSVVLTISLVISSFLFLFLYLFVISRTKPKRLIFIKTYSFLLLLPFLLWAGHFRMCQQAASPILDFLHKESKSASITGRLVHKEIIKDSVRLTLKDSYLILNKQYEKSVKVGKIIVYLSELEGVRLGNQVRVTGKTEAFSKPSNPGQFNEYQYYKSDNFTFKMYGKDIEVMDKDSSRYLEGLYELKTSLREVYEKLLSRRDAGILQAMILGEKSMLDPMTKELYQVNGIAHILAISGLHITMLGFTISKGLRKTGIPVLPTFVICCFFLYSYGLLTNFSVSTNRAVVMFLIFLMAEVMGRTYDILSAASLSALLILLQSPMKLFNAGFLLSFGAILGISCIYPVLQKNLSKSFRFLEYFFVSLSIQLVTLPIILYFFYEVPTYSIFINMLILPLSSLVILLAVAAGIGGLCFLPLGAFLAGGIHYVLSFYEFICKMAFNLPGRTVTTGRPEFLFILLYYGIILIFVVINHNKKHKVKLILLCMLGVIFIKPNDKLLKVTFLDVGQGDGIVVRTPVKTTFLIDGGSSDVKRLGQYRLEPYLKQKGITVIDYAIVTHGDADHISGLTELMEGMKSKKLEKGTRIENEYFTHVNIKNLILPDLSEEDKKLKKLKELAHKKGINVLYIQKGDMIQEGEVLITCLHPGKEFMGSNASSTVISLTFKDFDLLLTGDLEELGEEAVIVQLRKGTNQKVDYDVLKVAHHGSKNSTSKAFLQLVKPELSIISSGKNNRYGHPHKEVLKRLSLSQSETLLTMEEGAITLITDGIKLRVDRFKK